MLFMYFSFPQSFNKVPSCTQETITDSQFTIFVIACSPALLLRWKIPLPHARLPHRPDLPLSFPLVALYQPAFKPLLFVCALPDC